MFICKIIQNIFIRIGEALKYKTYKNQEIDIKVASYPINRGKGGAVRVVINFVF
jgi:hypothetical protein